ncbi:hypothetical protein HanIR_Chr14g0707261 [Helianthus annuus]|nr:uncharacterized protein LOC110904254 [Helianthus annuus]KAJ0469379.1 hypothetical protein HanIR_Chr14g0707261 [Helianthus annuus]
MASSLSTITARVFSVTMANLGMSIGEAVDFYRDRLGYKYRSISTLLLDGTVLGRLLQVETVCVYNQLAVQGLPQHYPYLDCVHEEHIVDSLECVALALLSSKQQPPCFSQARTWFFAKRLKT